MLFNSAEFIFVFLPVAIAIYYLVDRLADRMSAILVLGIASIFFYGYWDYRLLWVLIVSIAGNYIISRTIDRQSVNFLRKSYTVLGISFNLGLLFYFKYATFALSIINGLPAAQFSSVDIILPIGISFFTFQQITFLVDTYWKRNTKVDIRRYFLFVAFFPQLIAGPIVRHDEIIPQFTQKTNNPIVENLSVGGIIFIIGLAKKMILADSFAEISSPIFGFAADGLTLDFIEAWIAALAYALQIYFDFSGYSDMAIGLARMFGFVLPINFSSPYKARSIIEFWRCWHITLSRFLRDYLYIPLGGGKKGRPRTYANIIITMVLGGIWHGAGWTFLLWGSIHAIAITINHSWRNAGWEGRLGKWPAWALTFIIVVAAWVPFRAENMVTTVSIYTSMAGLNGITLPLSLAPWLQAHPEITNFIGLRATGSFLTKLHIWLPLLSGLFLIGFAPNTQTIMRDFKPGLQSRGYPSPIEAQSILSKRWSFARLPASINAILLGLLFTACLARLNNVSEFIYFQF